MADEEIFELPNEREERIELNKRYRAIPLKDTTFRTLRKYFSAAANLYGIIKLRKLYEIISAQCPNLITREEFLKFAEIAKDEIEGYAIFGEKDFYIDGKETPFMDYEVIDTITLWGDDEENGEYHYDTLKRQQEGKPFYIPEKKVFLRYCELGFHEATEHSQKLYDFLVSRLGISGDKAEEAIKDFTDSLNHDSQNPIANLNYLGEVYNADVDLSKKDLQTFIDLFTDFSNNSRMQCNRGHTPMELRELMPPSKKPPQMTLGPNIRQRIASGEISAEEMRKDVLAMKDIPELTRFSLLKEIADAEKLAPKPQKVGRNDPCPCGSGKKYKHCCGR